MRTAPYFHNQVGILTEVALHRYATPKYYEPDSLPEGFQRREGCRSSQRLVPGSVEGGVVANP